MALGAMEGGPDMLLAALSRDNYRREYGGGYCW